MEQELKDRLHQAVDLAEKPGACVYKRSDGRPCCVIAQLVVLEGIDLNLFTEGNSIYRFAEQPRFSAHADAKQLGEKYGIHLLSELQELWDSGVVLEKEVRELDGPVPSLPTKFHGAEERRAEMHRRVEAA